MAWAIAAPFMPNGVPPGQVVEGLVLGGLQSLIAMGLIIVYRSIRVINFAQTALGAVAASVAVLLVLARAHWQLLACDPHRYRLAVLTGFLVDLFIHWRFASSPRLIVTVVTIGIAPCLGSRPSSCPTSSTSRPSQTFKTPFRPTSRSTPDLHR